MKAGFNKTIFAYFQPEWINVLILYYFSNFCSEFKIYFGRKLMNSNGIR